MANELKEVNIQEAFAHLQEMANEFGDWLLEMHDSFILSDSRKAEALMKLVMQARAIANAGDQGVFLAKIFDDILKGE